MKAYNTTGQMRSLIDKAPPADSLVIEVWRLVDQSHLSNSDPRSQPNSHRANPWKFKSIQYLRWFAIGRFNKLLKNSPTWIDYEGVHALATLSCWGIFLVFNILDDNKFEEMERCEADVASRGVESNRSWSRGLGWKDDLASVYHWPWVRSGELNTLWFI